METEKEKLKNDSEKEFSATEAIIGKGLIKRKNLMRVQTSMSMMMLVTFEACHQHTYLYATSVTNINIAKMIFLHIRKLF